MTDSSSLRKRLAGSTWKDCLSKSNLYALRRLFLPDVPAGQAAHAVHITLAAFGKNNWPASADSVVRRILVAFNIFFQHEVKDLMHLVRYSLLLGNGETTVEVLQTCNF